MSISASSFSACSTTSTSTGNLKAPSSIYFNLYASPYLTTFLLPSVLHFRLTKAHDLSATERGVRLCKVSYTHLSFRPCSVLYVCLQCPTTFLLSSPPHTSLVRTPSLFPHRHHHDYLIILEGKRRFNSPFHSKDDFFKTIVFIYVLKVLRITHLHHSALLTDQVGPSIVS